MKISYIYFKEMKNLTWIIEFEDVTYCIDPFEADKIMDRIRGVPDIIINTHEHFDHIAGNEGLIKNGAKEIWAYEGAKKIIPSVTKGLQHKETIVISEGYELEIRFTPGHTMNHIVIFLKESNIIKHIFTGDTIFTAGVGNCYSGNLDSLYNSYKENFCDLDSTIKIYPGHDYCKTNLLFSLEQRPQNSDAKYYLDNYEKNGLNSLIPSTIAMEKSYNMFFMVSSKEEFFKFRNKRNNW